MRLPLTIGSTNFSSAVNRLHYSFGFLTRYGPNGGQMEDGTTTEDVQARKLQIVWPLNALTPDELSDLYRECAPADVTATVYDPRTKASATLTFHPLIASGTLMWAGTGPKYAVGMVLTLTEK